MKDNKTGPRKVVIPPREYAQNGGTRCPRCHSESVEVDGDLTRDNATTLLQPVRCETCRSLWTNRYALSDYISLSPLDSPLG